MIFLAEISKECQNIIVFTFDSLNLQPGRVSSGAGAPAGAHPDGSAGQDTCKMPTTNGSFPGWGCAPKAGCAGANGVTLHRDTTPQFRLEMKNAGQLGLEEELKNADLLILVVQMEFQLR